MSVVEDEEDEGVEDEADASAALAWYAQRWSERREPPEFRIMKGPSGNIVFEINGDAGRLEAKAKLGFALGSHSFAFCETIIAQLGQTPGTKASDPESVSKAINSGLEFIAANKPNTEMETTLLVQMWMTHSASIRHHRLLGAVEDLRQLEANGSLTIKLGKLFVQQVEALSKLRTAGKQVIEVQHVHIYPGAQAVVGTVHTGRGGGVGTGTGAQPHATTVGLADLRGEDAFGIPMPSLAGEREAPLPDARRDIAGGTEGAGERRMASRPPNKRRQGATPADRAAAEDIEGQLVGDSRR